MTAYVALFRGINVGGKHSLPMQEFADEQFGFAATVCLLTIDDYRSIVAANPYPDAVDTPKYLHAPDGIGRSRLAQKVDKCLGVETTGRNWRTVTRLEELADSIIS